MLSASPDSCVCLTFQNKPLYVGVDDGRSVSTREGLEQGYCVVPGDKRFLLLFTFLKKNMNKKVCEERPDWCWLIYAREE